VIAPDIRIRAAGDAALVLELPRRVDVETSARIVAIADALRRQCGAVIRDAVVGYHTLTVYFDPLGVDSRWLESQMVEIATGVQPGADVAGATIEVPVCYGGTYGPDLAYVARQAGCSEQEVIALHTAVEYRVFVVGFVPGFAYMGPVHEKLALPRRNSPRTRVPAGSVGIAAGQTGIYPMETPGGWHLIGRTPIRPFDPARLEPALFRPGDRVTFRAISADEFEAAVS
jgi:inhibitor of KinA